VSVYLAARWLHIGLGTLGFVLGLAAALLPKAGKNRAWHRNVGRTYAAAMLISAGLSVPLAIGLGSTVLFVVGVLTFLSLVLGWRAIVIVRSGRAAHRSKRLLRRHIALMGSSYIAAWTAFVLTNPIITVPGPLNRPLHLFGPTVIGSFFIARSIRRWAPLSPRGAGG
jgi:uncharacterized membrane protein YozB (DUF420 family)